MKGREAGGWSGEGGMGPSYVKTVRQRREGVRKQHGISVHQRIVTFCYTSMHNIKQPLNQKAEGAWRNIFCSHVLTSKKDRV